MALSPPTLQQKVIEYNLSTELEKLKMSCNLFNTSSHPNGNIWFGNGVLRTNNEDNGKNISRSSYFQLTLLSEIFYRWYSVIIVVMNTAVSRIWWTTEEMNTKTSERNVSTKSTENAVLKMMCVCIAIRYPLQRNTTM